MGGHKDGRLSLVPRCRSHDGRLSLVPQCRSQGWEIVIGASVVTRMGYCPRCLSVGHKDGRLSLVPRCRSHDGRLS
jgi:hypothetical protein